MPMLLKPIKCLHLAIKDTLVGVDVYIRVCSYREFFSWLLCAFYGHLLILWFARSSRGGYVNPVCCCKTAELMISDAPTM